MKNKLCYMLFCSLLFISCGNHNKSKEKVEVSNKYLSEIQIYDTIYSKCNKWINRTVFSTDDLDYKDLAFGYQSRWSEKETKEYTESLIRSGVFSIGITGTTEIKTEVDGQQLEGSINKGMFGVQEVWFRHVNNPSGNYYVQKYLEQEYGKVDFKSKVDSTLFWININNIVALTSDNNKSILIVAPFNKEFQQEFMSNGTYILRPMWKVVGNMEKYR